MVNVPTPGLPRYYMLYFRNTVRQVSPAWIWVEHDHVLHASDSFRWAEGKKADYVIKWCEAHSIMPVPQRASVRNIKQFYPKGRKRSTSSSTRTGKGRS